MVKTFIATLLLLLNCIPACFAGTPKAPAAFLEKSVPWIFVDSGNGVDTYIRIMRYNKEGRQNRTGPRETGEIDVLYDYRSESKMMLSAFKFDYLNHTCQETVTARPVIGYNGTRTERMGFDNSPNFKAAPVPQGSLIEKIANASCAAAPVLIERCLAGANKPETSGGSKGIRVIRLKDGSSFKIIFFPGDKKVLSGITGGKTGHYNVDYAVHESRRDGSLADAVNLFVYVSMGDTNINKYAGENPYYDIYRLSVSGGGGKLHYELKRIKEGTVPGQRDYSGDGT
jgi:hypothetical protein